MVDRIKDAVNAALAAKGWTQVDSGGDVSVVAMEITKNQQTLNTFYDGFGGGWRWGGFGDATTTTETYKVGTLVVDLFDAKAKNLILARLIQTAIPIRRWCWQIWCNQVRVSLCRT